MRRFQAVVVTFEHPVFGRCQIDTGYGRQVLPATRRMPERILRWTTPLPKKQWPFRQASNSAIETRDLPINGLNSNQNLAVDHLFLSHFHVDHIGGLGDVRAETIIYRQTALTALRSLSRWQRLHHGFLPALIADSAVLRGQGIDEKRWSVDSELDAGLATLDYWNDGSLRLVDLPGHSLGHYGFLLRGETQTLLYAVDAFWDYEVYRAARDLPWAGQKVQYHYGKYCQTQSQLRKFEREQGVTVLACHCERTQRYVEQTTD